MLIDLERSSAQELLEHVRQLLIRLFDAVATADDGTRSKEILKEVGWPRQSSKPPAKKLDAVLALTATQRMSLAAAIRNDIMFDDHLADPDFSFQFLELDSDVRDAAHALLSDMYAGAFRRKGLAGGEGAEVVSRSSLEQAFREANPLLEVCPACLTGVLERPINGNSALNLDHYLPQSMYAPLSLHHINLVPVCHVCNKPAKRDFDLLGSIDGVEGTLDDLWIPFHRSAHDELRLEYLVLEREGKRVVLTGDDDRARARAQRYDGAYRLGTRWSERLRPDTQKIVLRLKMDDVTDDVAAREVIAKLADEMERSELNDAGAFTCGRYARWLLEDRSAFAAFMKEYNDRE